MLTPDFSTHDAGRNWHPARDGQPGFFVYPVCGRCNADLCLCFHAGIRHSRQDLARVLKALRDVTDQIADALDAFQDWEPRKEDDDVLPWSL